LCHVGWLDTGAAGSQTFSICGAEANTDNTYAGDASTVNIYATLPWRSGQGASGTTATATSQRGVPTGAASLTRERDVIGYDAASNFVGDSDGTAAIRLGILDYELAGAGHTNLRDVVVWDNDLSAERITVGDNGTVFNPIVPSAGWAAASTTKYVRIPDTTQRIYQTGWDSALTDDLITRVDGTSEGTDATYTAVPDTAGDVIYMGSRNSSGFNGWTANVTAVWFFTTYDKTGITY
jgi:hypothetical protein